MGTRYPDNFRRGLLWNCYHFCWENFEFLVIFEWRFLLLFLNLDLVICDLLIASEIRGRTKNIFIKVFENRKIIHSFSGTKSAIPNFFFKLILLTAVLATISQNFSKNIAII